MALNRPVVIILWIFAEIAEKKLVSCKLTSLRFALQAQTLLQIMTLTSSQVPAGTQVLVLNGPNLNLLGSREPHIYGSTTLVDIERRCLEKCKELQLSGHFLQTNSEAEMLGWIHSAPKAGVQVIVINAGAWTHTSVAVRDALSGVNLPFIEVHLSNVYARETFRAHSYLSDLASGVLCGLGVQGYEFAICHAAALIDA